MIKIVLLVLIPLLTFFGGDPDQTLTGQNSKADGDTGTLQKMITAAGSVTMDLDLSRLNSSRVSAKQQKTNILRFDVEPNSFFTVLVFNDQLRGPLPSSMGMIPQNSAILPAKLNASYQHLVIEKTAWGEPFELVVRDAKTGFVFFNIDGHDYSYNAGDHTLSIQKGRLLLSKEFAAEIGRAAGLEVGQISISATLRAIEITQVVNGEVKSDILPGIDNPSVGTVPGPDVEVGDITGVSQGGSSGGFVGLGVGTTSCNYGQVDLDWFQLPSNDHPVIPQNLYRMSGGANNNDRFEQIGQSWLKHAFTALTENICSLGCNNNGGTHLGSGCSDPYSASLNYSQSGLGSRAWVNPFTGAYPGSSPNPADHTGHTHTGTSHRLLVAVSDLDTTQNPGATYFAEGQYVTPHEYAWCTAHAGQCNQYNNVSYRQFTVTGTTSFTFSGTNFSTQRAKTAISAWTGATFVQIEPDPGNDGIGTVAYKVTNPSAGVWHYEYAIYNQTLDRAIQMFSVAIGNGVTVSNLGFHAPPQHPGWAGDGTASNSGFSSTAWSPVQTATSLTWSSENLAQNPNANALRWGTLYNFRFDSNRPPTTANATIGFFKTGSPITIQVQAPSPVAAVPVSVSGRVMNSAGAPLSNIQLVISNSSGTIIGTALSSPFGYYQFSNVTAGQTYTVGASTKRYSFNPQTFQVNDNMTGVDFTALP